MKLLIFLYESHVWCLRTSGLLGKSKHLRLYYLQSGACVFLDQVDARVEMLCGVATEVAFNNILWEAPGTQRAVMMYWSWKFMATLYIIWQQLVLIVTRPCWAQTWILHVEVTFWFSSNFCAMHWGLELRNMANRRRPSPKSGQLTNCTYGLRWVVCQERCTTELKEHGARLWSGHCCIMYSKCFWLMLRTIHKIYLMINLPAVQSTYSNHLYNALYF